MKRIILLSVLLMGVTSFSIIHNLPVGYAADPTIYMGTVQASTTSAILRPRLPRRFKLVFTNVSNTYDCWITSRPVSYAGRTQGDWIQANGGKWTDENYRHYVSTWYVISDSGTPTIQYKEYE